MPIRNLHWYAANAGRAYPVDDAASCDDDAGVRLPSDLVVDLSLRWPRHLGRYAFVAAVANTPALVTLTIQASDDPAAAAGLTPLAVVSARKPVTPGRMVAVRPQAAGVGGWVAFGGGVNGGPAYSGRFSTPAQSRLTARAARAYRAPPVTGMQAGLAAATKLTGVVTLRATEPLALAKEERFLGGALRDCIVVRLVDDAGAEGFPVPAEAADVSGYKAPNVFAQFAGPCAGRPESSTCGCPNPIEFVNAVAPDCTGTITIEFRGCAQVAQVQELCGIALACDLGLTQVCLPLQVPTSEGLLPSEFEPVNVPVPPPVPPVVPPPGVSVSLVENPELPYVACFDDDLSELGTAAGGWAFTEADSPTPVCPTAYVPVPVSASLSASASVSLSTSLVPQPGGSFESARAGERCVALFDVDTTTVGRKATTEVMLRAGPAGARHNAQLVINYRPHTSLPGQFVYYAAEVDYERQEFRLLRFNGAAFAVVAPAVVSAPGIQLDKWYRIEATVLPGTSPGNVAISARLVSVTDPGVTDVTVAAETGSFQPQSGKFGIGTNRAISRFAYLTIEAAP